jgi:hypothetical protein
MIELKGSCLQKSRDTSGEFMSIVRSNVTSESDLNTHNMGNYRAAYAMYIYIYIVYETWSLTLREEHRLRMFEYRVPRNVSVHKREEVTGE